MGPGEDLKCQANPDPPERLTWARAGEVSAAPGGPPPVSLGAPGWAQFQGFRQALEGLEKGTHDNHCHCHCHYHFQVLRSWDTTYLGLRLKTRSRRTWFPILALLLLSCVTLGKTLYLSGPYLNFQYEDWLHTCKALRTAPGTWKGIINVRFL